MSSIASSWNDGLMVLMYHAVERPSLFCELQYLYVDPRKLRTQIRELQEAGVEFVRAANLEQATGEKRQVMLTFDDGFRSAFTNALPVLREAKVPAITYIVTGQIGGSNVWDYGRRLQKRPLMTRQEILEWVAAGYEVGAHTVTHCNLTTVTPEQARAEIFDSKKTLEDLLQKPVLDFCYPYGGWNPRLRDMVLEAGFTSAMTCNIGFNTAKTPRIELRRLTAKHTNPYLAALVP